MEVEQSAVSALAAGLEYAGKGQQRTAAGPTLQAAEGLSRVGTEGTTMQELRFVAVSEDGRYAVLAVPGRSARFMLPIDERLRAVALGQTSRLAQYEIEVESPLRPKEIQARIRAGETVEEIADAAGIAVERVRWFEGPVLAERAYMADQAQTASVRRHGDSTPGPRLGEIVAERLNAIGGDPDDAQWDAKKRGDGSWQVQLTFTSGGRLHTAEWVFDPRRRHVLANDDNAARMSLPGAEPPQPAAPLPGEATITQLAPRLSNARHERPASAPLRPSASEPAAPAPVPSAPPAPSVSVTAEPRTDVARPPAAERSSWPQPASREPGPGSPGRRGERARKPSGCSPARRRDGGRAAGRDRRRSRAGRGRRRADRAPEPQSGARSAILSPVLGRDHVRQFPPARLTASCPAIGHFLQAIWARVGLRPDSAKSLAVCRRGHCRERSR